MVQVPDPGLHILVHQILDLFAVLDNVGGCQDGGRDDHQKDQDNKGAVILHKLGNAGHGVDVVFQHIVIGSLGINGENSLIQDACKLLFLLSHYQRYAVLPIENTADLQVIVAHLGA